VFCMDKYAWQYAQAADTFKPLQYKNMGGQFIPLEQCSKQTSGNNEMKVPGAQILVISHGQVKCTCLIVI
jgi:hypothetical protein